MKIEATLKTLCEQNEKNELLVLNGHQFICVESKHKLGFLLLIFCVEILKLEINLLNF